MSYLILKDLEKRYTKGGNLVVNKMNLSIRKGEFIVFLGPSGCGKTTTIRMISGLEEVSGGDVLIEGESILHKKPKDRGVSMIFQSYAIWPHMTVFENIAYPLKLQKLSKSEIKERVMAAAEATDITALLDRYPTQMSGGQRQRVAVARAIVVKPKIFLMDEPLSNLDAKLRVSMRTELKNIHNKEHATSIFVTHDQSEAMSLADRIVIMNKGVVEQVGTPMEVYHDSATKFVASFIGTPPTNFFEVSIEEMNNELFAVSKSFQYRIQQELRKALKPYIHKTVDMGIRPEFIDIFHEDQVKSEYLYDTVIDFVEPQGTHSVLIVNLEGKEAKIVTTKYMDIRPGTKVSLYIRDGKAMFFDRETTLRIK
ncbi:multiple sugar transport system ATP-binding protein [Geosporobacter subterraneus DSM 17957]|uniref:Multiple sugar transport system ATP-binding protein n=1 Tax=Geosporobacter subterraneus DSM 17957 TaxID=1121919 RepID=A0A1M6MMB1_9FIRM|nr:ABC transporter ATP-binding protein [Geosporobacter subterraneus]SHJ84592.1 multiple sugar transport system ATP-binding protein [Geosporobacter subterraneus DSM 17957]